MIKASELITLFEKALNEGWGYIWGTRGQVWTQASQDRATRDMTVRYGQKWVGKRVADCSGLFVWAMKELGGEIYHGSNTMWKKYCTRQGTLTGEMHIKPGTAVFTVGSDGVRGHVGLYIGGNICIEAKGTAYGVVTSPLSRWDEWGELRYKQGGAWVEVEYDLPADVIEMAQRTLRKGDRGTDVEELQRILNADPRYPTKVDGIFGSDTEASVRAFQADHGLTADGIVGAKTWAKLREGQEPTEDDNGDKPGDTEDSSGETPSAVPDGSSPQGGASGWNTMTLEEKVEDLNSRLTALEGINYGGEDFLLPKGGDTNG